MPAPCPPRVSVPQDALGLPGRSTTKSCNILRTPCTLFGEKLHEGELKLGGQERGHGQQPPGTKFFSQCTHPPGVGAEPKSVPTFLPDGASSGGGCRARREGNLVNAACTPQH
jgi:hypothetical protein